jgi:hypothetical protein
VVDESAEGFEPQLWRALAVFRAAAVAYSVALIIRNDHLYRHPAAGVVAAVVMVLWTVVVTVLYARSTPR